MRGFVEEMDPDLVHYFNAVEAHLMQALGRQIEA